MSLINDMLKDLDRRSHRPTGGHVAALRGLGLAGPRMHGLPAGRTLFLGGAAVLIALVLAATGFKGMTHPQTARTPAGSLATASAGQTEPGGEGNGSRVPAANSDTSTTARPAPVEIPVAAGNDDESQNRRRRSAQAEAASPPSPVAKPVPEDTAARIEVTPRPLSPEQRLARDFQAAATAVADGKHAEAEHLLEDLLARDNAQHRARLLLAGLYVQEQRDSRAESVLASGLLHYPLHAPFAMLYAQLLAGQGRDSEAINALQTALPSAAGDADYHALLAGLYQRNGKPAAAINSYRTALRLAPAHGEWWTGLGISSEQANDAQTAAAAYREALRWRLTAALQQFVQERLDRLAAG